MSALGHMIELRGLATMVLGLFRPHMERIRPSRGLWLPFQFGRPLGEPCDPPFQHRVLDRAFDLLARDDGPVVLEDFPEDPPGSRDRQGWKPPLGPAVRENYQPDSALLDSFRQELSILDPFRQLALARFSRTTVGIADVEPRAWPDLAAQFLRGALRSVPPQFSNAGVMLRLIADDIKAYYGEVAQSQGEFPSSRQIDAWFWRQTAAGALINRLRLWAMASDVNSIRTVATRFLVPAQYQQDPFSASQV